MNLSPKTMMRVLKSYSPRVLVRLTYPAKFPQPGEAVMHINQICEYLKKKGNRGMWFLCQQARGAPFFWMVLSNYVPKEDISRTWFEIVGSGDPAHLKAGSSVSGFQYKKGSGQFLEKVIFPYLNNSTIPCGTYGSFKARILSWF